MAREISEHDATLAVEAAARKVYEDAVAAAQRANPDAARLPWDDLSANHKLAVRQQVLVPVWAALGALPDHRHTAWLEGYVAGSSDGSFEACGSGPIEGLVYPHTNPYPAEEA